MSVRATLSGSSLRIWKTFRVTSSFVCCIFFVDHIFRLAQVIGASSSSTSSLQAVRRRSRSIYWRPRRVVARRGGDRVREIERAPELAHRGDGAQLLDDRPRAVQCTLQLTRRAVHLKQLHERDQPVGGLAFPTKRARFRGLR